MKPVADRTIQYCPAEMFVYSFFTSLWIPSGHAKMSLRVAVLPDADDLALLIRRDFGCLKATPQACNSGLQHIVVTQWR
jgi:hypothetical protein